MKRYVAALLVVLGVVGLVGVLAVGRGFAEDENDASRAKFAEDTQDEARRSDLQVASRITIIPDFVLMQASPSVQQPCSNPSKSPELLGN